MHQNTFWVADGYEEHGAVKRLLEILALVLMVSIASEAAARDRGILATCDHVTCSGRGRCIVVGASLTCACDAGYMADPDGELSCIEEQAGMARLAGVAPSATTTKQAGPEVGLPADGLPSDDLLVSLFEPLSGFELDRVAKQYKQSGGQRGTNRSFDDYLEHRLRMKRLSGLAITSAGILLYLTTTVTFAVGANAPSDAEEVLLMVSIASFVAGTPLIIGGPFRWTRYKRYLNRYRAARWTRDKKEKAVSFRGIGPVLGRGNGPSGLTAGFVF